MPIQVFMVDSNVRRHTLALGSHTCIRVYLALQLLYRVPMCSSNSACASVELSTFMLDRSIIGMKKDIYLRCVLAQISSYIMKSYYFQMMRDQVSFKNHHIKHKSVSNAFHHTPK